MMIRLFLITYSKNMEGLARTPEGDQMRFMVFVIEAAAKKMSITPSELVERLERQDLIEGRLIKFYDMLHTQSVDYVADDIIETLNNYESDNEQ